MKLFCQETFNYTHKNSKPNTWPWTTEEHFMLEAGMMYTAKTKCCLIVNRRFYRTQSTKKDTLWLQWIYKKEISVQMITGKIQCCTTYKSMPTSAMISENSVRWTCASIGTTKTPRHRITLCLTLFLANKGPLLKACTSPIHLT